jgi:hypothetical protein
VSVPLTFIVEASLSLRDAMATQQGSKRKKLAAKPENSTSTGIKKAKVKAKTTPTRTKAEERINSEEASTETQKALRAAEVEVKRERQARIKAETALTEAHEDLVAAQLKVEQERHATTRRVSFVIRLKVDERGQFQWTEIEEVNSSKKKKFPTLNGEELVAFMKALISPAMMPEPAITRAPTPEKAVAPTPGPLSQKSSLIISDVQVFRPGDLNSITLLLTPGEPFVVQVRFQLQGPDARLLTTQAQSYEMKVYANEVTTDRRALLTTCDAGLIQDVIEYTASAEVSGLPPGIYRLFTEVTLAPSIKVADYYDKTFIHVI